MANGLADSRTPADAFLEAFQVGRSRAEQRRQQEIVNALNQQLRGVQLAREQRLLQEALKSPQERAVDVLNEQLARQAATPESGVALRPSMIQPTPTVEGIPAPPALREGEMPVSDMFTFTPSVKESAETRKSQQRIQEARARAEAAGIPVEQTVDIQGNVVLLPKRVVAGQESAAPITTGVTAQPKGKAGVTRELTPNAKLAISRQAGLAGIDLEEIRQKFTDDQGNVDYERLSIESGTRIRQDAQDKLKAQQGKMSATVREKAQGFIGAYNDLLNLEETIREIKADSREEPGAWQRAVSRELETPPGGVFSSIYQQIIGKTLTSDAKDLSGLKARLRGAITRAQAGLSQTEKEIINLTPFTPQAEDGFEDTIRKLGGLQEYIGSQVQAATTNPDDWLQSLQAGTITPLQVPRLPSQGGAAPTPQATPPAPIQIRSIRRKAS